MPERSNRPILTLDDAEIARVIENATSVGGFLPSPCRCENCKEHYLICLPAKPPEKIHNAYRPKQLPATYATVCLICDEVFNFPKINP